MLGNRRLPQPHLVPRTANHGGKTKDWSEVLQKAGALESGEKDRQASTIGVEVAINLTSAQ